MKKVCLQVIGFLIKTDEKSNVQTACVFIQLYWDGSFSVFSVR